MRDARDIWALLSRAWYGPASSWWRCVDRKIFISILALLTFSIVLVASTGGLMSHKSGFSHNHFIYRQIFYIAFGLALLIILSFIDRASLARFIALGFAVNIALLIALQFFGTSVKGATRWISVLGISIQPSEIIKPFFLCVTAFILSSKNYQIRFSAKVIFAVSIYLVLSSLIIIQPDFGMLVMMSAGFGLQLFMSGIPVMWILFSGIFLICSAAGSYIFLPHVEDRINNFLSADLSKNYQVKKALMAFKSGSMYGNGIGEGKVKKVLPDAHTDFIFSVAAEELGIITCLLITFIFAFLVIRVLLKTLRVDNDFFRLAIFGLIAEFGLQGFANIAVNLHMLPTKGLTLPLVSYGGSSVISSCILFGIILNLSRNDQNAYSYSIGKIVV